MHARARRRARPRRSRGAPRARARRTGFGASSQHLRLRRQLDPGERGIEPSREVLAADVEHLPAHLQQLAEPDLAGLVAAAREQLVVVEERQRVALQLLGRGDLQGAARARALQLDLRGASRRVELETQAAHLRVRRRALALAALEERRRDLEEAERDVVAIVALVAGAERERGPALPARRALPGLGRAQPGLERQEIGA